MVAWGGTIFEMFRGTSVGVGTIALLCTSMLLVSKSSLASSDEDLAYIKGGHETKMCEWPTTVWLRSCTATLIHPRVAIYAAHCGSKISSLFFGEEDKSKGSISPKVKFCRTNPEYRSSSDLGKGVDYAFCLLEEPMEKMPIAPIGYGCELEHIDPKNPVWLVGFGVNDNKEGRPTYGVKRMVKTNIGKKSADGTELELGRLGFVSSNGDSGGPAYIKLPDGSWRTVGITSWGAGPGPNWYVSAAVAVPWIHKILKEEGYDDIDITPCFDDDGTWAPSKDCGGFALDPGTAYGTYEQQCAVEAPLSGPSASCGEPNPEAKGAENAVGLSFTAPKADQVFGTDQDIEVKIKVSNVGKEQELEVTLFVGDEAQDTLDEAPFTWTLKGLAAKKHELVAKLVVKKSGAKSQTKPLLIQVQDKGDAEPSEDDTAKSDAGTPDGSNSSDDASSDSQAPKDSAESSSSDKSPKLDKDLKKADEGCQVQGTRSWVWSLGLMGLLLGFRRSRGR